MCIFNICTCIYRTFIEIEFTEKPVRIDSARFVCTATKLHTINATNLLCFADDAGNSSRRKWLSAAIGKLNLFCFNLWKRTSRICKVRLCYGNVLNCKYAFIK